MRAMCSAVRSAAIVPQSTDSRAPHLSGIFAAVPHAGRAPFQNVSVSYVDHQDRPRPSDGQTVLTDADLSEFADVRHAPALRRSLATRALLRKALSDATDGHIRPRAWTFERDAGGKPRLTGHTPLHFGCSHTHAMSAVAVSTQGPVGIDIESSLATFEPGLHEAYFTARERHALALLPPSAAATARARLWTLKEATVKMLGTGLECNVSKLEFDLQRDRLVSCRDRRFDLASMRVATWSVPTPSHSLCVALSVA